MPTYNAAVRDSYAGLTLHVSLNSRTERLN